MTRTREENAADLAHEAATPKKRWRVRIAAREICYVERHVYVEAEDESEARAKALDNDIVDSGHDCRCEPEGLEEIIVALDCYDKPYPIVEVKE